ncbi:MAG: UbiA family prenyltransferase [Bacteroidota bacterium]
MPVLNIVSLFDKSTVKHLRLPFSYHLMPVFLFALSQTANINWQTTAIAFVILHFFIYPSSNGYNSYQDKDETSIGGLKHPPKVSENLLHVTLLLDTAGILLSLIISIYFSLFVLLYVLISRAYSYRNLRLKKYAIPGFLTVMIFQGAFTYIMVLSATGNFENVYLISLDNLLCMFISSLFIGSVYPLTQIYQHQADKKDGVDTISYKLGYTGTFLFSGALFSVASTLLFYYFNLKNQTTAFILFLILMMPVVIRLLLWFNKVRKSPDDANYENTMAMNLLASTCMNVYFLILIFNNMYRVF